MGAVRVGDHIIDANGMPSRVTYKSDVFIGRKCLEVEFSSGERVVCDADHLWVTDSHRDRGNQAGCDRKTPVPTVKTTSEIAKTLKVPSGKYIINNHRTKLCGPLVLQEADLPIPPYALGVWLGDGASECARVTAGCDEVDAMSARLSDCGQTNYISGVYPEKGSATIALVDRRGVRRGVFTRPARQLNLINNKHIPRIYLRASKHQRTELLMGLMDSDGYIESRQGRCIFTTTRESLRDDVTELVASLGFKPLVTSKIPHIGQKACRRAWNVSFTAFADVPVFKIPRKVNRQLPRPLCAARSESRQIIAVREVASVPTQCISVASGTKQFLITRSLIPTHNTTEGGAILVDALLMNRRPNAEFIYVGPTQDVSQLAFRQSTGMIEADPVLRAKFHVTPHLKLIKYLPTGAFAKVKSFDPKVVTGVKPSGVLFDELHVVATAPEADRVIGQLRGGMVSQPEAFMVFITTQSERPPAGVFAAELAKARGIRDGRIKNATMLPVIYEFPDGVDWENPANWWMVTPNNGRSVSVDRLIPDYHGAKESGEGEFRRWASQHLNIEIGLALHHDRWAGADFWEPAGINLSLEELLDRSEVVTVGIDGGGLDDLLGLAVCGRDRQTKDWLLWTRAWAHPIVFQRRKALTGTLRGFERDGDLVVCAEIGSDIADVAEIVAGIDARGLLSQVGLDPIGVGAIIDALAEHNITGDRLVGIPQGYKLMGAIKTAERKLAEGTLWHSGQRMMDWCVGNAKVEPRGNAIAITKQAAGSAKIDPLMAAFDAIALMSMAPEAMSGASWWDTDAA